MVRLCSGEAGAGEPCWKQLSCQGIVRHVKCAEIALPEQTVGLPGFSSGTWQRGEYNIRACVWVVATPLFLL